MDASFLTQQFQEIEEDMLLQVNEKNIVIVKDLWITKTISIWAVPFSEFNRLSRNFQHSLSLLSSLGM